jgi:alkyl sulfatase BDS1-like metallo-beta-lactamase superfamily hydrolase
MDAGPDRPFWKLTPDREVFVGQDYDFTLGEVRFQVIALQNGGEGEDSLLVWLPDQKVLFTGDLFGTLYPMFPNLYTVRGEKYRDPLDYIDALDLVLSLEPEIMVPTHFHVIEGADYIRRSVTQMRDAVQFVWDETLERMNAGKTVWEAMEEIELPPELALSQGHGKVSWSVRAAWEILAGWYHYDSVANLYHVPPDAVYADLIELSGGSDALAKRARRYLDAGRPLEALRLLDIAGVAPTKRVLETRAAVLEQLVRAAREGLNNYTEVGLLEADLRGTRERLEASAAP